MCNLNILIKNNEKIEENNLLNFFNSSVYNSFIQNSHAEGIYFNHNDILLTSEKKLNLFDYKQNFDLSSFIISHSRFITSGRDFFNTQPFKKNGFVFAHNGVLSDFVTTSNNNSDTLNLFDKFLNLFDKFYKENKNRDTAIKKSIKKCLDKISGSYSIVLFDIKTSSLYYFKNDLTEIHFYINNDKTLLYITTIKENKGFFNIYDTNIKELVVKNYLIYKITFSRKNRIVFSSLGKINKRKEEYTISHYFPKSSLKSLEGSIKSAFDSEKSFNERFREFKRDWNININNSSNKCDNCLEMTFNSCGSVGGFLCDSCLKEEMLEQEIEMEKYGSRYIN